MKNILTFILFACFTIALNAQDAKSSFLTRTEVDWMDQEIKDLEKSYVVIDNALKEKDGIAVSRNKTEIIKSVTSLSSNSQQFYNKIMLDTEREESRRTVLSDNTPEYYYNKRKNNPKNQELLLTSDNLKTFHSNYTAMQKIKETLKESSFALHPQQEESMDNLKLVADFIVIAKRNNQILQNAKKVD